MPKLYQKFKYLDKMYLVFQFFFLKVFQSLNSNHIKLISYLNETNYI